MEVVDVKVASLRKGASGDGKKYCTLSEWMADPENLYIGRQWVVFVKNEETGGKERVPKRDSVWANPFKLETSKDRATCIERYRAYNPGSHRQGRSRPERAEEQTPWVLVQAAAVPRRRAMRTVQTFQT